MCRFGQTFQKCGAILRQGNRGAQRSKSHRQCPDARETEGTGVDNYPVYNCCCQTAPRNQWSKARHLFVITSRTVFCGLLGARNTSWEIGVMPLSAPV